MWELGKDPLQLQGVFFCKVVVPLMAKGFANLGFGRDLLQVWIYSEDGFFLLADLPGERLIPHSK